jgi:hypothetical protein
MRKIAICTLACSLLFACAGIWQISMLREVCDPLLNADTGRDFVIRAASVFETRKELSLSFGFAYLSVEAAVLFTIISAVLVILTWKRRMPNHSTDPTSTSVTPAAKQPARHP